MVLPRPKASDVSVSDFTMVAGISFVGRSRSGLVIKANVLKHLQFGIRQVAKQSASKVALIG